MSQWQKLRYFILRPNLRRIARWAGTKPDPVERLRFLRERMGAVPTQYLFDPRSRIQNIMTAVATTILVMAAILLWRAI